MLDKLTLQNKIILFSLLFLLILVVFYKTIISPVFNKNDILNNQISNEISLAKYLQESQVKLNGNKLFSKLSVANAKKIINSNFKNIKKNITIKNSKITLVAKSQNFKKIIKNIDNLKNKYGLL